MEELSLEEICTRLKQAGRLESDPLCAYGSETIPANSISSTSINRCIANVIYSLAINLERSTIHFEEDNEKKSCPGGQAWLGYKPLMPHLKYMLSTGTPDFRGGWSEFLIADPDLTEKRLKGIGSIKLNSSPFKHFKLFANPCELIQSFLLFLNRIGQTLNHLIEIRMIN